MLNPYILRGIYSFSFIASFDIPQDDWIWWIVTGSSECENHSLSDSNSITQITRPLVPIGLVSRNYTVTNGLLRNIDFSHAHV